ncbi:MAG: acetolactate synthase small subunit [Clostridiales bacterium]|jgi:acetolactate synthase-1/3 small subunit|nr:acetolactate synthase small subunit [Eubacteriales bacterium]MDN5314701.1 acetolactate synthase small subunit [Clostridiales bacterium]
MNTQHVLSVLVNNNAGLLYKVAGLFSRRGFNIESLTVGTCELADKSRMTIVVNGNEATIDQVIRQLDKLIDVIEIERLPRDHDVERELVLIQVNSSSDTRAEMIQIAEIFRANIIDVSHKSLTFELTGQQDKINAFISLLEPFGVRRIVRTGLTALERSM